MCQWLTTDKSWDTDSRRTTKNLTWGQRALGMARKNIGTWLMWCISFGVDSIWWPYRGLAHAPYRPECHENEVLCVAVCNILSRHFSARALGVGAEHPRNSSVCDLRFGRMLTTANIIERMRLFASAQEWNTSHSGWPRTGRFPTF